MWFKVDDTLATHPKAVSAGLRAMGLWTLAGAWSAQHLTDGHIPAYVLPVLGARKQDAEALVKAGLWGREDAGYRFHDWGRYQPTGEEVQAAKDAKAEGGRHGNHVRWHAKKGVRIEGCPWCFQVAQPIA